MQTIPALTLAIYALLLILVAWWTDSKGEKALPNAVRPFLFALALGVYCSSWTFLGAVGQTVQSGWHFLPIYLGPILLIIFGWPFIKKLMTSARHNHVTSVADFLGSRYGKSRSLAVLVTVILIIGTLPYISLQLRALDITFANLNTEEVLMNQAGKNSNILIPLALAAFAIFFGTRVISGANRLQGLVTAIAVESLIKVVAFVAIGIVAINLKLELYPTTHIITDTLSFSQIMSDKFFTEMLLASVAIFLLPRQFHLMFVEQHDESDAKHTRWLLPLYLAIFAFFVIPIAEVGVQLFGGSMLSPDSYVLMIPQFFEYDWLTSLTMIGTFSAATGMVVMAAISLSIMISNEILIPYWLKRHKIANSSYMSLGTSIKYIRRMAIVLLLIASWVINQALAQVEGLANLGLISFAACAQLLPVTFAAIYWEKGHSKGAIAGIAVGMLLWFYCLLLPQLIGNQHPVVTGEFFGTPLIASYSILNMGFLDPLTHGVLWSLFANGLVFYLVSIRQKQSTLDLRQAAAFLSFDRRKRTVDLSTSNIVGADIKSLLLPLLGKERIDALWSKFEKSIGNVLLDSQAVPNFVVFEAERQLASITGATSAHRIIQLLTDRQPLNIEDLVKLVEGSSKQTLFSHQLLQTTIENIPQGISVVDSNQKLVAWNNRYVEMFDYPSTLLYVGGDIESIYRFNINRGFIDVGDHNIEEVLARRIDQLKSGQYYRVIRELHNGKVIEIRGTPLSNGGYVTTFLDISDYSNAVKELEQSKANLEARVEERTQALQDANESLERENSLRAKVEKELKQTYDNKNRFMASATHDLLQPVNAARLFVGALQDNKEVKVSPSISEHLGHIDDALTQTEQIIESLRDIARLESGREKAKIKRFPLNNILQPLAAEGTAMIADKPIRLRYHPTSLWTESDPQLLRRAIQNLVSNAIRYTDHGSVVIGCRRKAEQTILYVIDTGRGIEKGDQQRIFDEFERLATSTDQQGLGLGLSITKRITSLLGHRLSLSSQPNKGSTFCMTLPIVEAQQTSTSTQQNTDPKLDGVKVLCVDNEPRILLGMRSLLEQWGCQVTTAHSLGESLSNWNYDFPPDVLLVDYHLDSETGPDVVEAHRLHWHQEIPAMVITADNSEKVMQDASNHGLKVLTKPVKPNALRVQLRKMLN